MNDQHAPNGFLRLSDAVDRLTKGMWGGLPRPVPVRIVKQTFKRASVGSVSWRMEASRCFRAAVLKGQLAVCVVADSQTSSKNPSPGTIEPVTVPMSVLERLITSREGLPDHAIRPSLKTTGGNEKLFALLR